MMEPKSFHFSNTRDDSITIVFNESENIDDGSFNFNLSTHSYVINGLAWFKMYIEDVYQEWFINKFPELIGNVGNLRDDLRAKYSHLMFGDKFGFFKD